jgi:hypothetical protein
MLRRVVGDLRRREREPLVARDRDVRGFGVVLTRRRDEMNLLRIGDRDAAVAGIDGERIGARPGDEDRVVDL